MSCLVERIRRESPLILKADTPHPHPLARNKSSSWTRRDMMNHTSPRAPASLDPWQRDVSCVDVRAVGMAIRGELAFGRGFHLLLCFGRRICRHSRIPQQGYREGGPCHVDNSKGIRGVQVLEIAGYVVLGASRAPSFSSLHRHCAGGEGEAYAELHLVLAPTAMLI